MKELSGLATGIGSLPYKDAQEALRVVFKYCPQIPFWPQLPRRDIKEGMVAQFCEHMPCVRLAGQGAVFSAAAKEQELERFYQEVISNNLDHFKISRDYAEGLYAFCGELEKAGHRGIEAVKCHITGPFTFTASFKDENGTSLLHDRVFMQAFTKGLGLKARWQIKLLRQFGKKVIIFIDEPYLACFGSAYTPVNREEVISTLAELTQEIKEEGTLIGVHCCGNTDWSVFTDTGGIDIINFDAFGFFDKLALYADNLEGFFSRGGMLCWGIVPTQEFDGRQEPQELIDKIDKGIAALAKKGVDRAQAKSGLLLSPACGLGTMDPEKAEGVLRLLSEVSARMRSP